MIAFVAHCALSVAFSALPVALQELNEKPHTAEKPQAQIALIMSRRQLVQAIGKSDASYANRTDLSQKLRDLSVESGIQHRRQKFGLEAWKPTEAEKLIAMRTAAGEFLGAVNETRVFERRRIQRANEKKKAGCGTTAHSVSSLGSGSFIAQCPPRDVPPSELNR